MNKTLDLTKPITTRDGRPVTLLFTNGRGEWKIGGYIGDSLIMSTWLEQGYAMGSRKESQADLINAPEEITLYINLYKNEDGSYTGYIYDKEVSAVEGAILKQYPIKVTLP